MIIREGEILKINSLRNKRILAIVSSAKTMNAEEVFILRPIYKPSPKSLLRKKNHFSKNTFKLTF